MTYRVITGWERGCKQPVTGLNIYIIIIMLTKSMCTTSKFNRIYHKYTIVISTLSRESIMKMK